MRIVDHEPKTWFLAQENGALFLDTNCNHSFFAYSFLIELSPEEIAEFKSQGRKYLNSLAQKIQDSAPILTTSNSCFKGRDVSANYAQKLQRAIENWRKTNS